MDHDRLFKELLSSCFVEFLDLFLPAVAGYIDHDIALVPLDKELIADISAGGKREADLVMRVKFRDKDAYFLVHVENQARSQTTFPRRMFRYFARLTEKYDLPVYPVVIYSHRSPLRLEPNRYDVEFPDLVVLQFRYAVIQLNQMSWRKFVDSENPVACALMTRMKMTREERPRVKMECLRLLAKLKVDPAKATLIGRFISTYLRLNEEEMVRFEREIETLAPSEKEITMALVSEWEQKGIDIGIALGIEQGIEQGIERGIEKGALLGKEKLVARQIRRRFYGEAAVPEHVIGAMARLSPDQLDDLGVALLDFPTVSDLEAWLASH